MVLHIAKKNEHPASVQDPGNSPMADCFYTHLNIAYHLGADSSWLLEVAVLWVYDPLDCMWLLYYVLCRLDWHVDVVACACRFCCVLCTCLTCLVHTRCICYKAYIVNCVYLQLVQVSHLCCRVHAYADAYPLCMACALLWPYLGILPLPCH